MAANSIHAQEKEKIEFDYKIRTNAELAEEITTGFLLKSIKDNPKGFLDIYLSWEKEKRIDFGNKIIGLTELFHTFTNIYDNTKNDKYKKASMEIIQFINGFAK